MKKKLNLHFRRFEFKYFLDKNIADRLIPTLMNYMEWDPYVGDKEYYECHSLYFDNDRLKAYHEKIDGFLNRKKVRIRTYNRDYKQTDPLFFEIKRKSGEIILKDRVVLPANYLEKFIEDPFSVQNHKDADPDFANELVFEMINYQMSPKLLVSYKRKPFFAKNDSTFRVTFDYDLEFAKANGGNYNEEFTPLREDFVIMEVKFTGILPKWFHEIIENFQLVKTDSCKYVFGTDLLNGEPSYS